MDDLLHISPEFYWDLNNPTNNDMIYCATSIGLNSSVLFQHFLQMAIRSKARAIILSGNSTYEDISAVCKRNGLNMNDSIQLISVSDIEEEFLNQPTILNQIKGYHCDRLFPQAQLSPPSCQHCSVTNAPSFFEQAIETLASQNVTDSVFFIVDDVHFLGGSDFAILQTVRKLRNIIENHFDHFTFIIQHPCGVDNETELYYQFVHMSDIQMMLLPLSTGHSSTVHGSLVLHRNLKGNSFENITLRRHIKISDSSVKLFVPGSI